MGACYVDGDARDRDRVVGRIQRTAIPAGNPIVVAEGAGRAPDADEPGQPMLPKQSCGRLLRVHADRSRELLHLGDGMPEHATAHDLMLPTSLDGVEPVETDARRALQFEHGPHQVQTEPATDKRRIHASQPERGGGVQAHELGLKEPAHTPYLADRRRSHDLLRQAGRQTVPDGHSPGRGSVLGPMAQDLRQRARGCARHGDGNPHTSQHRGPHQPARRINGMVGRHEEALVDAVRPPDPPYTGP